MSSNVEPGEGVITTKEFESFQQWMNTWVSVAATSEMDCCASIPFSPFPTVVSFTEGQV